MHHIVSLCKTRFTLFNTGSTQEKSRHGWKSLDWQMRVQMGGQGVWTPPPPHERSQKKVFLALLVRIPWKIAKLLGQNSMLGHHQDASETPFLLRADDGPLLVVFWSSLLSSTKNKNKKKYVIKVGPPLTNVSESAHDWDVKCQRK